MTANELRATTFDSSLALRRLDRWAPWVFAAVLVGLGVKFLQFGKRSEWDDVYLDAAGSIAQQGPLYGEFSVYTYPPLTAWLAIPFTLLPPLSSRLLWLAINVVCFVGMIRLAWRWVYPAGSDQGLSDADRWKRWAVFAFGLLLGGRAMTNCMLHHQTDLVVGVLVFLGVDLVLKSRPTLAAVPIGLAAGLKCTPLMWLAFFFWTGPRRAGLLVGLVAVAANLLPDLTHPTPGTWLGAWLNGVLFNTLETNKYPGQWNVDPMTNQSLAGSFFAWIVTTWTWDAGGFQYHPLSTPRLSPTAAKGLVYGIGLSLMLVSFLRLRWAPLSSKSPRTPTAVECGMVLCLMLLLSPMSHKTHFGLLLAPGFALGGLWMENRTRWMTATLAIVLALQVVSLRAVSVPLASLASWHGAQMLSTMGLLVGCWIALAQRPAAALQLEPIPLRRAA
jgi:hypothetical protein